MSSFCNNGCRFFGSPATLNLCSKCYRDHCKNQPLIVDFSKLSINESRSSDHESVGGGGAEKKNCCSSCRKRVGLLGFKCRCGKTFCSLHRYAEEHGCTFDYKQTARKALAKANPCVKADKLERI